MKTINRISLSIALCTGFLVLAAFPAFPASGLAGKQTASSANSQRNNASPAAEQNPGERKFKQNCSRCHLAPESFSPRISGTIVRHMRIRASLSRQDERDILHFLNP